MSAAPTRKRGSDWVLHHVLPRSWLFFALLVAWEAAPHLGLVDPLLLPPLSSVLARGQALLLNGRLLGDLLASIRRVVLGFGLAALLAFPLGVTLGLYPALERPSSGLLSALRPLSPPAWIPLAILWFGIGDAPAVFIIFVGTFATLLVGTLSAAHAVDAHTVKAALTLGASRWQAVWHVILPGILPDLITQTRIGLGLAWMCVIAAEMVAVRRGIGFMMIEARNLFRIADVLVGMLCISLVGMGTDGLLRLLERRVCRWRRGLEAAQLYAGPEGQA